MRKTCFYYFLVLVQTLPVISQTRNLELGCLLSHALNPCTKQLEELGDFQYVWFLILKTVMFLKTNKKLFYYFLKNIFSSLESVFFVLSVSFHDTEPTIFFFVLVLLIF